MSDRSGYQQKVRPLWNPRALQLLREPRAARLARSVVPAQVDGVNIVFPDPTVRLGLCISVNSPRLPGRPLLDMMYQSATQAESVRMGLVALKALSAVPAKPGANIVGRLYHPVRRLKVECRGGLVDAIAGASDRKRLMWLLNRGLDSLGQQTESVVVHGDLHAGNILVDEASSSLAFLDLELLHIGQAVTNFAQLWLSYRIADLALAEEFARRYLDSVGLTHDESFAWRWRAEVALRCVFLVEAGLRGGNQELHEKAEAILHEMLNFVSG